MTLTGILAVNDAAMCQVQTKFYLEMRHRGYAMSDMRTGEAVFTVLAGVTRNSASDCEARDPITCISPQDRRCASKQNLASIGLTYSGHDAPGKYIEFWLAVIGSMT